LKIDSKEEITYIVQPTDLAKELFIDEQDDFPEVLATSRMLALMEIAAARLMKSVLKEGELSVGVNVTIDHLAATPNNEEVKAIAIYKGMKGKLYQFIVELYDKGGRVGEGSHTRAVVKTERLIQGALNRVKK